MTPPSTHLRAHRRPRARRLLGAAVGAAVVLSLLVATGSASAASTPRVTWSSASVVAGSSLTADVDADSRPRGSTLRLERKFPDRWRVADREATKVGDGWRLHVPTSQFGTFTYRVVAVRDGSVVSKSPTTTITVRPPYKPAGRDGQHSFSAKPRVRWDSCDRIRWTFNRKNAPRRGLRQVKGAVKRVHQATGLDFRYVGRTTRKPTPYGRDLAGADVIIGWRTPQDYGFFRKNKGAVGVGGNTYLMGYQESDGTRVGKATSGGVVLNAAQKRNLRNGFGRGYTWGEVIMHELGHVLGLAHTDASSQVMYFQTIPRKATWGAGDLAGLRRLGNVRGCLQRVPSRPLVEIGSTRTR